jgi:hypothetical protein
MKCYQPFVLFILLSNQSISQGEKGAKIYSIEVTSNIGKHKLLDAQQLYDENWHTLAQPQFWKIIMRTPPEYTILNVSTTRQILDTVFSREWHKLSTEKRLAHKDSLRKKYHVDSTIRINETVGKSDFYRFDDVYPSIERGLEVFETNGVDPWYAQSILLIESPGQLVKSNVGAFGPFQLMPSVARAQGLVVNEKKDERADFSRSAYAAAQLLKKSMIPSAKRICASFGLKYDEYDTWFRLLVLHIYHAGAGNVEAVLRKIDPKQGGQELIRSMWVNTAGGFGNNSQNYSQLALAAHFFLDDLIHLRCIDIQKCSN